MKGFLTGILCLISTVIFGQLEFTAPTVTGPNAAAIAQYGEIPVSHFTGVPHISIPITTIQEGSISLPVSLNYHASGIKVEQQASWVGLGWSLSAGGAIVRYVNGIPDEFGTFSGNYGDPNLPGSVSGHTNPVYIKGTSANGYTNLLAAKNRQLDVEPDIYVFNFGGYSGKFFPCETGFCQVNSSDLKINKIPGWELGDWEIVDPMGTKYIFGGYTATERSYTAGINDNLHHQYNQSSTTWYLLKVESYDGANALNLTYTDESYVLTNKEHSATNFKHNYGHRAKVIEDSYKTTTTIVKGKRITGIQASSGKNRVEFIGGAGRLDQLKPYNQPGTPVALAKIRIVDESFSKDFVLNTGYFTKATTYTFPWPPYNSIPSVKNQRLKLLGLKEVSSTGSEMPGYSFIYDNQSMPDITSKSEDYWGYFNNKANKSLVPNGFINPLTNQPEYHSATYGDRQIDGTAAQVGILKEIKFPTGGNTKFNYECNSTLINGISKKVGGLRISSVVSNPLNAPAMTKTYQYDAGVVYGGVIDPNSYVVKNYNFNNVPPLLNTFPRPALNTSIVGFPIGYTKVTEGNTGTGKMEYYFKNSPSASSPQSTFPYIPEIVDPNIGLQDKIITYNSANAITAKVEFNYSSYHYNNINGRKLFFFEDFQSNISNDDFVMQSAYCLKTYRTNLLSKTTTTDGVVTTENYAYAPQGNTLYGHKHHNPIKVSTTGSDGITYEKETFYLGDYSTSTGPDPSQIGVPIKTITKAHGQVTGWSEVKYSAFNWIKRPSEFVSYGQNNQIISKTIIDSYNARGKATSYHVVGDVTNSIIYDKYNERPVANVNNSALNETAFTSFENSNSYGGWSYTSSNIENNAAVLGTKAFRLNSPIQKSVPSGNYIMAFWAKGQGTLKAGSQSIQGTPTWTYYEVPINGTYYSPAKIYQTVAYTPPGGGGGPIIKGGFDDDDYEPLGGFGGGGGTTTPTHASYLFLDEVRLFPADAQMKTHTYNEKGALEGMADINGGITTYNYDEWLRLKDIRDKNGHIVKANKYENPLYGNHSVSQYVPQQAYTSSYTFDNASASQVHKTSSFHDGLGRQSISVAYDMSAMNNDLISFTVFDKFGKSPREYQGYSGSFNINTTPASHKTNSINFYTSIFGAQEGQYSYSQNIYESDISIRMIEKTIPGQHHSIGSGHTSTTSYRGYLPNPTADGPVYNYGIYGGNVYTINELNVVVSTDGDGREIKTFSDNLGRKIMDDVEGLQTYYIYDLRSNLIGVLPPETSKKAKTHSARYYSGIKQAFGDEMFWYEFDSQNRLTSKHIPGAEPTTYGYDALDRPVWALDGNGNKTWKEYDILSRPKKSGIYSGSTKIVHKEIYYDNYAHASGQGFVSKVGYDQNHFGFVRGEVTGNLTKILDGGNTMMKSTAYYDEFYRPIYSISENHTGGFDQNWTKYDFNGRELNSEYYQRVYAEFNLINTSVKSRYTYDHAGRLKALFKSTNNEPELKTSSIEYDELGQIKTKFLHSSGSFPLANERYQYDLRGRLKSQSTSTGSSTSNDVFNLNYYFEDSGVNGSYSGNISRITWSTNGGALKEYNFQYDDQYRLTTADHMINGNNSAAYDLNNLTYDDNGNILGLKRYSNTGALMDNLLMTYTADKNQLAAVTETSPENDGFVTGKVGSGNYQYDNNGNLTYDPYKGITLTYNHFDVPTTVSNADASIGAVDWVYDGDGNTLSMQSSLPGSAKRLYVNGFEYYGGVLESAMFEEGRIKFCDGGANVEYEYHINDHLGNTRIAFSQINGSIRINQENHFYPFGLEMEGNWNNVYCGDNKYKYNGIEKIEGAGLNNYFAFYRTLDPSIGRWWQVDPKAEAVRSLSPYQSMGNNPISFSDPAGDLFLPLIAAIPLLKGITVSAFTVNAVGITFTAAAIIKSSSAGAIVASFGATTAAYGTWGHSPFGLGNQPMLNSDIVYHASQPGASSEWYYDPHTGEMDFVRAIDGDMGTQIVNIVQYGERPAALYGSVTDKSIARFITTHVGEGQAPGFWFSKYMAATGRLQHSNIIFDAIGMGGVVKALGRTLIRASLKQGATNAGVASLRNGHLAGKLHPVTKVPFTKSGFPNFYKNLYKGGKNDVFIKPTGSRAGDFAAANKTAGYSSTPKGYTWHHHQTTGRMQLVNRSIHAKTGHTGGFSLWKF